MYDRLEMDPLRRKGGKPGLEIEPHLVSEHAECASSGSVGFWPTILENVSDQIKVLLHIT